MKIILEHPSVNTSTASQSPLACPGLNGVQGAEKVTRVSSVPAERQPPGLLGKARRLLENPRFAMPVGGAVTAASLTGSIFICGPMAMLAIPGSLLFCAGLNTWLQNRSSSY
jgi:hypothetical protein